MTPAIFGIAGPSLSDAERAFFREADPAGYILFARNCIAPDQLRALTDSLRALNGRDELLVMIDEEGGRVQRLSRDHWPRFPAGEAFDRLYEIAPISAMEAARANAELLGRELAAMGISADAAPLLDVRRDETDNVIGDRALGRDPLRVAALGRAILDGLGAAGVAGIVKHMPGHGRATCDTHKALPTVTADATALEEDIAPFRMLADHPLATMGMTAHIVFTAWDAELPATQSPAVVEQVIRGAIGFDGLLMTDDLDMEALSGSVPERAETAVRAGVDLALNCWAKMADMEGIAARLPAMGARTVERLARANTATRAEPTADPAELLARRDALLALAA